MSQHHKNSTNPKIRKLQNDYAELASEFGTRNPYLLGLIDRTRKEMSRRVRGFGYMEACQMIRLLDRSGYSSRLHSNRDFQDAKIFWNLMDHARQMQLESGDTRAIRAVNILYENLDKHGAFGDRFKNHPKSPYKYLRKIDFFDMMCNEYTHSSDVFIINYSRKNDPIVLILPYRNTFLRSVVVESFERDQCKDTTTKDETRALCNMEDIFGPYAETIRSLDDFRSEVLTYAKNHIMERYSDDERMRVKFMKHLWCIFRHAVKSDPQRDLFMDSVLWHSQLILSYRIPILIAQGYTPVIVEGMGDIPAYEKVIFVYSNGERFGADSNGYGMFCIDFSEIKSDLYRWLAINFIASTDQRRHPIVVSFLHWLECMKESSGYKYSKKDWIYADELCSFRTLVSLKTANKSSRNSYLRCIVTFLRWAAGTQRLHLQKGVFRYFPAFKQRYNPKPRSLNSSERKSLEDALIRLSARDPRYLLTLNIFLITLRSDIRAGQLCALDLSRMIWNDNGTSSYISRVKNRGGGMVRTDFSRTATSLIRDAMKLTEEARSVCPVDGLQTCLYLYKGLRPTDRHIAVMNITRYNDDLRDACREAGIDHISSGNVRDTRQTAVARFARKHNLNEAQTATLTRHANRTSLNSYVDLHVEDLLTAAESISLGTIDR